VQEVAIISPNIFAYKGFRVDVGYMVGKGDLPHYLVRNVGYDVIEYACSRLMEARAMCVVLGEQTEEQERSIATGELFTEVVQEEKEKKELKEKWN